MASRRNKKSKRARKIKASQVLTWIGFGALAIAIVVVGFFAFRGDGDEGPGRSLRQTPVVTDERQVSVKVVDNDFEPRDLTVRPDAEVTWEFEGRLAHDVTDEEGAFESGTMRDGDEYSVTFEDPGEYFYYCSLHHSMTGTVRVVP